MTERHTSFMLVFAAVFSVSTVYADGLRFESGPQRVELIELYTSEGCSSCPPADRWLSKLKKHPGLWSEFAPIAFHVDYWDYIGWQDRFAKAEFSDRQRAYAREGAAPFVYTPGLFRNGDDWRDWRSESLKPGPVAETGVLSVEIDDQVVQVRFESFDSGSLPFVAHVAVLGMDRSTDVRAGENRGKQLPHDFVALEVKSTSLESRDGVYDSTVVFEEGTFPGDGQTALVAWVSGKDSLVPLQAAGGYLPQK